MAILAPMAILVGVLASYSSDLAADQNLRRELFALAQNVYFESRGESTQGQQAVAWVTINRTKDGRWPDTISGVVWQSRQFSWTLDRSKHHIRLTDEIEAQAWRDAVIVAYMVYFKLVPDPTRGSTYFYAHDLVKPRWSKKLTFVARIDGHTFMK